MIDLSAVRQRVRDIALPDQGPFFNVVSDALSASDAMENLDATPPSAYVHIAGERSKPNDIAAGGRRKRTTSTISVLGVLGTNRADGERADPLEIARGVVIASLDGWQAPGAISAMDYTSFRVVRLGDGMLWFEVLFTADWLIGG